MGTRRLLVAAAALALGAALPASAQPKDIVDTAVAAGSFKTLAKLLTDAELIGVMKGPGPYTVFAPTDEAFAKVPKDVLEALAKDKAKLQEVLKYHVLTSKWTTDDIKLVKQTGTAQGKAVSFGAAGGALTVNGAKVIKPNIDCTNGMVHVIDAVLLPPQ
ncbi:MAG TPA: fasciclin domain-containing protein [Vicinamibacteria bacterium]|nr:fasciclin domain-containing protein [Vicinamibacteria bacterium]